MADPLNVLALDDVKRITKLEIAPLIASEKAITDKLNAIDSAKGGSMEDIIQDAQKKQRCRGGRREPSKPSRKPSRRSTWTKLAASSEEAPVIKLANLIMVQAIKDRASDIHLEPFEKSMRLRYRVDGVLMDATPPPKQDATGAGLALQNHEQPRHRRTPPAAGRAHARQGQRQGLRFARFVLPTVHGEKIVLRVLDKSNLVRQHRQARPGRGHLQAVQGRH
jgi:type IV pilus assembly protein PilB